MVLDGSLLALVHILSNTLAGQVRVVGYQISFTVWNDQKGLTLV